MRNLFKPRPNSFLKLLQDQATLTLKGLDLLKDYMQGQNPSVAQQLTATEKEADEVRRILIDELNRTFVTPMDREDIFALSRTIDDVLDYAYSTVDEMEILQVKPTPMMAELTTWVVLTGPPSRAAPRITVADVTWALKPCTGRIL